jgi:hypothetical protein
MNGKKRSNRSLIILCAMLIAKYEVYKDFHAFMEVTENGNIEYRDKTGTIHNHTLLFQEIPSCGDSGYTFDACKRLAEEYVQAVIDSLHARLPDMRVFNATKIFSPISHPMELPLLYRNAHLWLQVLLNHFCLGGCKLVNHDGSSGRCALNITTLDALMRIAMAKIPMESLDSEDIWER